VSQGVLETEESQQKVLAAIPDPGNDIYHLTLIHKRRTQKHNCPSLARQKIFAKRQMERLESNYRG
jgi:hypothetical protein